MAAQLSDRAADNFYWDDPAMQEKNGPLGKSPKKLAAFIDGYIPSFQYQGERNKPGAVFRCRDHVTGWGIAWKELRAGDSAVILPVLVNKEQRHPESGLRILELQGLNNDTVLLIVEEKNIRSGEHMTYGLILDYTKMKLDLCETVTRKGCLMRKEQTAHLWWSPEDMKDQWEIIEDELAEFNHGFQLREVTPPKPTSNKRAGKRKTGARAPKDTEGEAPFEPPEGTTPPPKKSRKGKKEGIRALEDAKEEVPLVRKTKDGQELTLHACVDMSESQVLKLNVEDMKYIKELYEHAFGGLYKWGKRAMCGDDGNLIRVHFDHLHKAPHGWLIYRGIDEHRLKGIKNQVRIAPDFDSDVRVITVLPLKGVPPTSPGNEVTYYNTEPPKKTFEDKDAHYFIIGGQHTVEAHKNLVEASEIEEKDKERASTFNIIPVWAAVNDAGVDLLMTLSRSLNQNLVGERREQKWTQQLVNARIKWRSMGSPAPAIMGRTHSAKYLAFLRTSMTIFAGMKSGNSSDQKYPLVFLENDADVTRWLEIEANYMKGLLPDARNTVDKEGKLKRKPLLQTDFKPLYGLRVEDINYLASQVEAQNITMKKSSLSDGKALMNLECAARIERFVRAMKNELLQHYKNYPLPSKSAKYSPYPESMWEEFAMEKEITRSELEMWVHIAMAHPVGQEWFKGRTRPLNKSYKPEDCPQLVTDMWKAFFKERGDAEVMRELEVEFRKRYLCKIVDNESWNISETLSTPDVKAWREAKEPCIYFWFMFEGTPLGAKAKILEQEKLERMFSALESHDPKDNTISARSGAIFFTDAEGFYMIKAHMEKQGKKTGAKVWNFHVVNYMAGSMDGFPSPTSGKQFNVFVVFVFGTDSNRDPRACFKSFFPGLDNLQPLYDAKNMSNDKYFWRRQHVPYLKINTPMTIFKGLNCRGGILVNVNGGPEITHLGLHWKGVKVLELVESTEAVLESKEWAKQIWDAQRTKSRSQAKDGHDKGANLQEIVNNTPLTTSSSKLIPQQQTARSSEKEQEDGMDQTEPSTLLKDLRQKQYVDYKEQANFLLMQVDSSEDLNPSTLNSPMVGIQQESGEWQDDISQASRVLDAQHNLPQVSGPNRELEEVVQGVEWAQAPGDPSSVPKPATVWEGSRTLVNVNEGLEITQLVSHAKGIEVAKALESAEMAMGGKKWTKQIRDAQCAKPKSQVEEARNRGASLQEIRDNVPPIASPFERIPWQQKTGTTGKDQMSDGGMDSREPSTPAEDIEQRQSIDYIEQVIPPSTWVDPLKDLNLLAQDSPVVGVRQELDGKQEDVLGAPRALEAQRNLPQVHGSTRVQEELAQEVGWTRSREDEDEVRRAEQPQQLSNLSSPGATARVVVLSDDGELILEPHFEPPLEGSMPAKDPEQGQSIDCIEQVLPPLMHVDPLKDLDLPTPDSPMVGVQQELDGWQEDVLGAPRALEAKRDSPQVPSPTQPQEELAQEVEQTHTREDRDGTRGTQPSQQLSNPSFLGVATEIVVLSDDSESVLEPHLEPPLEGHRARENMAKGEEAAAGSSCVSIRNQRRKRDPTAAPREEEENSNKKKNHALVDLLDLGACNADEQEVAHTLQCMWSPGQKKELMGGSTSESESHIVPRGPMVPQVTVVYSRKRQRKDGQSQAVDAKPRFSSPSPLPPKKSVRSKKRNAKPRNPTPDDPSSALRSLSLVQSKNRKAKPKNQKSKVPKPNGQLSVPHRPSLVLLPSPALSKPGSQKEDHSIGITGEQSNGVIAPSASPPKMPLPPMGRIVGFTGSVPTWLTVDVIPISLVEQDTALLGSDVTSKANAPVDVTVAAWGEGEGGEYEALNVKDDPGAWYRDLNDFVFGNGQLRTPFYEHEPLRNPHLVIARKKKLGKEKEIQGGKKKKKELFHEDKLQKKIEARIKKTKEIETLKEATMCIYGPIIEWAQGWQGMQTEVANDVGRGVATDAIIGMSREKEFKSGIVDSALSDKHMRPYVTSEGVATNARANSSAGNQATNRDVAGAPGLGDDVQACLLRRAPRRQYHVVLEPSGVLVQWYIDAATNQRSFKMREGCMNFLEWLYGNANLVFWSSMSTRNVNRAVAFLLHQSKVINRQKVIVLSQEHCILSKYRNPSQPSKPFYLKDLATLLNILKLDSLDNVVLVDDSPMENLTNDRYNTIYPPHWDGVVQDQHLQAGVYSWLNGLFESNKPVRQYAQKNTLSCAQFFRNPSRQLRDQILNGIPR